MSGGSKICPECGGLNSRNAESCHRCGSPFPGGVSNWFSGTVGSLLGKEYPITRLYVGLCVLVYGLMVMDGAPFAVLPGGDDEDPLAISRLLRFGGLISGLSEAEPWRLCSAMFVHFGLMHLGFNCMGMVDLGKMLEPQLGSARYTVLLVSTGILGFVASEIWYTQTSGFPIPTGGISGAVFGLVGAWVGMLYARRSPAWKAIAMRVAVYSLLFAVLLPMNNAAHLGGGLSGVAFGIAFYKEKRPWKRHRLMRGFATLGILITFAGLVLCQTSDLWRIRRSFELQQSSLLVPLAPARLCYSAAPARLCYSAAPARLCYSSSALAA